MTQKELLYIDDTLSHLEYLIKITNNAIESLENDDLRDYLKDILKTFTKEEKSIKKLLEG